MDIFITLLGGQLANTVLKIWLDDDEIAASVLSDASAVLGGRLGTLKQKRAAVRFLDRVAERAGESMANFVAVEYSQMPQNDVTAAVEFVASTLEKSPIDLGDLFVANLDPNELHRQIVESSEYKSRLNASFRSGDVGRLANDVLKQACRIICRSALHLPGFQSAALVELLERESEMFDRFDGVVRELQSLSSPVTNAAATDDRRFELDYGDAVIARLGHLELAGVTLDTRYRRYPLDIAYLSLRCITRVQGTALDDEINDVESVSSALGGKTRVVISGDAGSGKTTLLQWLSVGCIKNDLPEDLSSLNGRIPFFIRLRSYSERPFPAPEEFVDSIASQLAGAMPHGCVHRIMQQDRALLLVDGLDEVTESRREEARVWLEDLLALFPTVPVVVTSRPPALDESWRQLDGFEYIEMSDMSPREIRRFVSKWHEAASSASASNEHREKLKDWKRALYQQLDSQPYLAQLGRTPLILAMLCATNADRRGSLPSNRRDLYRSAINMLMHRREREKRDAAVHPVLDEFEEQRLQFLFQHFALWLLENGYADCSRSQAEGLFGAKAYGDSASQVQSETLFSALLTRSGLIREPVPGRIDFVHRTFQEYLAAKEIVRQAKIGQLLLCADDDQWREVVVFAAGEASEHNLEGLRQIISELVRLGNEDPHKRQDFHLLAISCQESVSEMPEEQADQLSEILGGLVPPTTMSAAHSIASGGDRAIPLLMECYDGGVRATEAVCIVRALATIGGDVALSALAKIGPDSRVTVARELIRAWSSFDREAYAQRVLSQSVLDGGSLAVDQSAEIRNLGHLRNLRDLAVDWGRSWGWDGFDPLTDLNNLEHLSLTLDRARLDGTVVSAVSGIPESVRTQLTAQQSVAYTLDLQSWSSVTFLDLRHSDLGGIDSVPTSLRGLVLDHCYPLEDLSGLDGSNITKLSCSDTMVTRLPTLPVVNEVRALNCRELLEVHGVGGAALESLQVSGPVNGGSLGQLVSSSPNLRTLIALGVVSGRSIRSPASLEALEQIVLHTDALAAGVSDWLFALPNAKRIEIAAQLDSLGEPEDSLECLDLRGCDFDAVELLKLKYSKVVALGLSASNLDFDLLPELCDSLALELLVIDGADDLSINEIHRLAECCGSLVVGRSGNLSPRDIGELGWQQSYLSTGSEPRHWLLSSRTVRLEVGGPLTQTASPNLSLFPGDSSWRWNTVL